MQFIGRFRLGFDFFQSLGQGFGGGGKKNKKQVNVEPVLQWQPCNHAIMLQQHANTTMF